MSTFTPFLHPKVSSVARASARTFSVRIAIYQFIHTQAEKGSVIIQLGPQARYAGVTVTLVLVTILNSAGIPAELWFCHFCVGLRPSN